MTHYLFSIIPRLLFEPVAVTAICAVFFAFIVYWKKHDRFYWICVFSIAIMLGWRVACYSIMSSSRYAAILLYPATALSAWLCFFLRDALKRYFDRLPSLKTPLAGKIFSILPFFLILVLAIACTIKTLRHDPYSSYIIRLCKALVRETAGKKYVLLSDIQRPRIAYYAKIEERNILCMGLENNALWKSLRDRVFAWCGNISPIYFIFYVQKGMPEPDAEFLNIESEIGKWECIHREYTSYRKNREIVLYRLIPAHPNVEVWEKPIPPISPKNLCINGDCERFLEGSALKGRIAYYKSIQASDFYTTPGRKFPIGWWFGVSKAGDGFSNMALTDKRPIAGKYSLEMDSGKGWSWGMNSGFIRKQNCTFSGFLRAESDAVIRLYSCYWDPIGKGTRFIRSYYLYLDAGKTYRFSFPVRKDEVPKKAQSIYLIVQGSGHVLMDNVEFVRTDSSVQ